MLITRRLKEAATAAFRDNARLAEMSPEDREAAARQYERLAGEAVGVRAELARRYNLERARFLRGQVDHLAPSAPDFADEIGYSGNGG
jgi:hypothetical protein